ncbi:thioredoxin [uncultured Caudovirales phage]|uniref:Thioredoxin n=1 Tax=uncultured Caudovirales phage TaxID=2100421 RepID=A0A6J5L647_9CAUD|nr:thioredoxin [uncultured Caudovirales phage]
MEQLTSGQIEEKINNGEDFILKMYAVWCGPCKQLTEELKKITTNVPIYEFDVESDISFSKKLGVRNVPVLKFYKEGVDTHTMVGLKPAQTVSSLILEYINN